MSTIRASAISPAMLSFYLEFFLLARRAYHDHEKFALLVKLADFSDPLELEDRGLACIGDFCPDGVVSVVPVFLDGDGLQDLEVFLCS